MGKKTGKAGKVVSPTKPSKPVEADVADPGKAAKIKAEQAQSEGVTSSSVKKPHKPPPPEAEQAAVAESASEELEEKKTSWIEIELVGEDDEPIPGEKYLIMLPDGESVAKGTLDENGFARIEGFEKGTCKVCFPDIDKEAWEKI